MRRISALALAALACAGLASPQGRPLDWTFYAGDAQRTGWEKVDSRITKDNVKNFQLVLKRKFDSKQRGPRSLTPPVIIGNLISYRGFKELAFVVDSSDNMWAIDADLDRIFWEKHFDGSSENPKPVSTSPACSAAVTAMPSLTPPINFAARTPRGTPPVNRGASSPGAPPTPAAAPTPVHGILGSGGFGSPRPAFAVSSDGKLHLLNTSRGDDVTPAISFLPPNAKASSLTVLDGIVYTTTSGGCGGSQNGVWAVDLNSQEPKLTSFALNGGDVSALGGLSLGTDGTVYVQTGSGPLEPSANKWSNSVIALTPKELKLKNYFTSPDGSKTMKRGAAAPVVFAQNGRDLIVSAGSDGSLYLLDAQSLGGDDHKTPLYRTPPVSSGDGGIWGGLSTWQDADGTRWVLAPVWGAINPELKASATNGAAPNGSIVAFKLEESNGKPVLTPGWVSRNMHSPVPPVLTGGIVFALSAGEYTREEKPKGSTHAILYALDAATGKEIYTTGNQVNAPGSLTGVTLANGRVYFATTDNTLYAFGIFLER